MAIIQFHTPKGIIKVNSNTITDKQLEALNINRQALNELIKSSRDLLAEIDQIKADIVELKGAKG